MKGNEIEKDPCEFCRILRNPITAKTKLLYSDDNFFAFEDITKATAKEHILVCTKSHIETAQDVQDKNILYEMKEKGRKILDEICEKEGWHQEYRFGFHLRPYNSIDHIHLHCFVLPFTSLIKDKIVYGKMLTKVEEVVLKLNDKKMEESLGRL